MKASHRPFATVSDGKEWVRMAQASFLFGQQSADQVSSVMYFNNRGSFQLSDLRTASHLLYTFSKVSLNTLYLHVEKIKQVWSYFNSPQRGAACKKEGKQVHTARVSKDRAECQQS